MIHKDILLVYEMIFKKQIIPYLILKDIMSF